MTECAQSIALAGWTGDECPKCTDQQDWRKQARDTYNELYRKGYPDGNPMLMVLTFVYEQSLSVCDLGCGGATLATFFDKYTGLDVSDVVIDRNQVTKPDARFYVASLDDLRVVKGDKFDLAICCDVMEHIPPQAVEQVMAEIATLNADRIAFGISCVDSIYRDSNGDSLHLSINPPQVWIQIISRHLRVSRHIYNDGFLMLEAVPKG